MKKYTPIAYLVSGVMLLVGCVKSGPVPIAYGEDACAFCKMTIVDTRFGCEMQTDKGKTYKFDDLFCLVKYREQQMPGSDNTAHMFIADFLSGQFVEHTQASFLFNPEFKSPMGGNIAAFASEASLKEVMQEKGGEILQWEQVTTMSAK